MHCNNIKKVILLGSGALKIGEAGEFDYSGSQAAKALKEEGIQTILINPNIATIQTSQDFVSQIYFLPVNSYFVEKVIEKEHPDGILLGFGGQTALNCGLELYKKGILKKYNVKVLGTPVKSIDKTEDRLKFRKSIEELGLKVPKSVLCKNLNELKKISSGIFFPVIVRAGFSLGGLGSGIARNLSELESLAKTALAVTPQILIEEYLDKWKEIEYEVVRDIEDNAITVCNMENLDPMGIHTGESIVVAPSQTLTNQEYHSLREIAIKVIRSLNIIGECNIQYALNPKNGDYRIIEVNARLSRSSALASKATGYPLAYVAAKLALGYKLSEIENQVTKSTISFFEPALDYIVVKIPRWDFLKFKWLNEKLGSEMQSVGEVMSIGRTFEEALQKAIRSLDLDYEGIISDDLDRKILKRKSDFKNLEPTPSRIYNIAFNLFHGQSIDQIYEITGIDKWFIERIEKIVKLYKSLIKVENIENLSKSLLLDAKRYGFSDKQLGEVFNKSWKDIRTLRKKMHIIPYICQIDTLAGEFPAKTNYLYMSYSREENDVQPIKEKSVGILGGGPYQIGSSVEFDWCAVNSVMTAKKNGFKTIMVNCNPETVSTDYDISDRLYFEELTLERVLDIAEFEKCPLIVSVGGQIPNTLAAKLENENVKLLGNSSQTIDKAEDREKFSELLDKLKIKQPRWARLKSKEAALEFAEKLDYPVLIRPSYVLSGKAMFTAYSKNALIAYLENSDSIVNSEYPLVMSKFIRGAKEVDFDAVCQNGKVIIWAVSEHVEHSGVHSGDATLVLPSFSLTKFAKQKILKISNKIIKALNINGPVNIQFLVNHDGDFDLEVLVIEANLRASRSFPFVSKVFNINFIDLATKILLGMRVKPIENFQKPKYFAIKTPHFSFTRLRGTDPVLGVEMASTGEVACFGDDIFEAFLKSLISIGMKWPGKKALISLGGSEAKERLLRTMQILAELGFKLYATEHTAKYLRENKIRAIDVYKVQDNKSPNVVDMISKRAVNIVINLSDRSDIGLKNIQKQITDGYLIRRAAVDVNIPLFTKATLATLFVKALRRYNMDKLKIKSYKSYIKKYNAQ
jgi:carbamoyl-phosphate synthase large subunit